MNNWIRIEEQLPDEKTPVLLTDGEVMVTGFIDHFMNGAVYTRMYGVTGFECDFDFNSDEITHWMPLPAKPLEE